MPRRDDHYDFPELAKSTGLITDFRDEHAFLSNFYMEPFYVKSLLVPSAEHAFQAAKTTDPWWRERIIETATAHEAKHLGNRCPLRPGWDERRVSVMREILRWKFALRSDLATKLLLTGGKHLVEGNNWGDRFWGCERDPAERGTWCGANHLGILLMERRKELQNDIPY